MSEDTIVIEGNGKLEGEVTVAGAKNSALKLIAASLLGHGTSTIRNVPLISDITVMCEVLKYLGARITRTKDVLVIDTGQVDKFKTPYELVSKMRASISVLGPLVARFGQAHVAMPGGCQIGARKIDIHLKGLEALGVSFEMDHGYLQASTPQGLHGAHVVLDFPSVGATENLLMAAVAADGHTIIENAAREPEIVDLANMLCAMNARVEGAGTAILEIEGIPLSKLRPCDHTTCGDRIEAGTFLAGGALTGGPVVVHGIDPSYLRMVLMKLTELGCTVETGDDWVSVKRTTPLQAIDIQTLPHPGFPTDLQAQFMLLTSIAHGTSVITENIFENRFMFAAELGRMGADITIEDHHALIHGVSGLQGAPVAAPDLRAGAALVLAGIIAEGETRVENAAYIDRGYEGFVEKLCALGANVGRVSSSA